ncbi:unnamed protein product, partial [Chrysoparadoxa australica]
DGAPLIKWDLLPFPMELSGVVLFSPSPSGKRLAIVREVAGGGDAGANGAAAGVEGGAAGFKSYNIEIWSTGAAAGEPSGMVHRIATGSAHGDMMSSGWFGGFAWSKCESYAVYVARKVPPKTRSFFAANPKEGDVSVPGAQYEYREDWGEKHVGVSEVDMFVLRFAAGTVTAVPGVPANVTPGQPQLTADGGLIYTAWSGQPRKLGILFCFQRPCKLYSTNISPLLEESTEEVELVHQCLT